MEPVELQAVLVRISRVAAVEDDLVSRFNGSAQLAFHSRHGRMVGLSWILHAPSQTSFEIVLEMNRPALERIVTMGIVLPGVLLVSPVVRPALVVLVAPVPAGPASPRRLLRIVHPR